MKYRHKPTEVEAVRYTGKNIHEIEDLISEKLFARLNYDFEIETTHGLVTVTPGDWIIFAEGAGAWPITDELFRASYDPADQPVQPASPEPTPTAALDQKQQSIKALLTGALAVGDQAARMYELAGQTIGAAIYVINGDQQAAGEQIDVVMKALKGVAQVHAETNKS